MMRKLALALVFFALPLFASTRPVTVDRLEELLAASQGKSDAKLARQLSGLALTERLNATRLAQWQKKLPGPGSRRALVVLFDLALFLPLPANEIPAWRPPSLEAQRQLIASAVNYTEKTIHELPNLTATRDTIHFEDSPRTFTGESHDLAGTLHAVSKSTAIVFYRDGNEVIEPKSTKVEASSEKVHGLTTSGEFGPILGTVLVDAAHGKLFWSHWEHGPNGPMAVFQFEVPKTDSHYQVAFCCRIAGDAADLFQQFPGYHGELAVDAIDGSILRLAMQANLKREDTITRADIIVEYGPIEIGGRTYICPERSVSVAVGPVPGGHAYYNRAELLDPVKVPPIERDVLQTSLNDVAFDSYHVFRAESRILGAGERASTEDNSEHEPVATTVTPPSASIADIAASATPESAPTTAASGVTARWPIDPNGSKKTSPATTEAADPEISEVGSTVAPDIPRVGEPGKTRLRITTRLVDVGVVALDKKGRPVTDLKPEDFEVYDNGQKQAVRYFLPPGSASAPNLATGATHPGAPADQPVYSNHRSDVAGAPIAGGERESSTTIVLIDGNNLAFADLALVRGQVLGFLNGLSANQRIGLYVQHGRGFQVLAEATTDHNLIAAKMRSWMPNSQDLARAQEEEQRNREQIDDVLHLQDLAYVNGNTNPSGQPEVMVDPQLRDLGSNPGRVAMSALVGVAAQLAAIPGHKNLVWVASENVLADWSDKAIGIEKGGKHNDPFILRAEEALNDAHVSLYPLDASQLETMATDPSLQNPAVELSPSVTVPTREQGGVKGGRQAAEMMQDIHPVQVAIQEMARATGGRTFRRGGDFIRNLNSVVDDGSATYLLGFTPNMPADDQYHSVTVKLTMRRNVVLRFRTGYEYAKEPATMKDRFRQAVWQPNDAREIALSASRLPAYGGTAFRLKIAAGDLELNRQGDRWMDKLDIFVVRRSEDGFVARITGHTLGLALRQSTYENLKDKGIPFDQFVERTQDTASLRILVVDENSGRIGSVTLPPSVLNRGN